MVKTAGDYSFPQHISVTGPIDVTGSVDITGSLGLSGATVISGGTESRLSPFYVKVSGGMSRLEIRSR
ncbi:MAG: hypothetical protein ABSG21_15925 [Spirochaetia bacterium]